MRGNNSDDDDFQLPNARAHNEEEAFGVDVPVTHSVVPAKATSSGDSKATALGSSDSRLEDLRARFKYLEKMPEYCEKEKTASFASLNQTLEFELKVLNSKGHEFENPAMDYNFEVSEHKLHINQSRHGDGADDVILLTDIHNNPRIPDIVTIGGAGQSVLIGCMGIVITGRNKETGAVDLIATHATRYLEPGVEKRARNPIGYLQKFVAEHDDIQIIGTTSFKVADLEPEEVRAILSEKLKYEIEEESIHDSNGLYFFPRLRIGLAVDQDDAVNFLEVYATMHKVRIWEEERVGNSDKNNQQANPVTAAESESKIPDDALVDAFVSKLKTSYSEKDAKPIIDIINKKGFSEIVRLASIAESSHDFTFSIGSKEPKKVLGVLKELMLSQNDLIKQFDETAIRRVLGKAVTVSQEAAVENAGKRMKAGEG